MRENFRSCHYQISSIYLNAVYIFDIDDVLSLNNPKFNDYIDVIYPKELEIKATTDAPKWANYLDLHLEFDEDDKLFMRLYDERDDIDSPVVNFPYLSTCSNIPEFPAYGVLVSQLIRYARVCSKYEDFCSDDLIWFQSY